MIRNYIKITFRNLLRNKVSTSINLLSLSLGISVSLIVFLVITYEHDFDGFHSKKDRIFRVVRERSNSSGINYTSSVPYPLDAALVNDYPELEAVTQIFASSEHQFERGEDKWIEQDILFADSNFFKVFDFEVVSGNPFEAFKHPGVAFVTESFVSKHFKNHSPIGETIKLSGRIDLEIVGIVKDPPGNSHIPFSVIISKESFHKDLVGGFDYDNWNASLGFTNYILLPAGDTKLNFENKLSNIPSKYMSEEAEQSRFFLQPLNEIHFDSRFASSNPGYTLDVTYLWILGSVGFFVLLLACINFINLSTAISIRKSKEVGVRKVMGATRAQLVYQYLGEALLLTAVSLLISLGVTERILPLLNSFMGVQLSFDLLGDGSTAFFVILILLFVTFASGLYPAWILSSYKPVAALKNKISSSSNSSFFLRRGLVTAQFIISQMLIIGTIVVARQMDFFRSKPLGFDKEYIVTTFLDDQDPVKLETLKNKILTNPSVEHVSFAVGVPTSDNDIGTSLKIEGEEEALSVRIKAVDYDYKETFNLSLAAGTWFINKDMNQAGKEFLLNEAAIRQLGYSSPEEAIGKIVSFDLTDLDGAIVGVVRDFHTKPLHEAIQPVIMLQFPKLYIEAGLKISSINVPETLDFIKTNWEEAFPESLFDYHFLDEALAANYAREQKIYTMFRVFSAMAIGIGCLGLFGLISFLVIQKTKEVGVRKVLGASIPGIVVLFSRDFMLLIGIAFLIAAPVSWYGMEQWLSEFAYRIDLNPFYFLLGGLINVIIAFGTISYQAVKAAAANPVDSLRSE